MTQELSLLKSLEQRIKRIEKAVALEKASGDWINAKDVEKDYGFKQRTLRAMRDSGKLKNVRCANGRKYQYSRTELEKFYTA